MSTINQIQLPNGSIYDFEDTAAREAASSKADKTLATTSANGLMSAADKKAVDREFLRMLPKGGTVIPNGANLNSTAYLKVGNYYQSANVNTTNMTNIPFKHAFMMYVLSPLSETYDNESTGQWVYRLRIFITFTGDGIFVQKVSSGNTAGSFDYGSWVKMTNSNDLGAVSKIINDHIANKSNPHGVTKAQVGLGSVANLDQSKAIKSIIRSGTTFTATALDGTTSTFTQQDNNTTYGVATSSADGLMSKADKAKLDTLEEQIRDLPDLLRDIVKSINSVNQSIAKLYPVGSIYLSVNDTDPGTFIGGTWERLKDVFLLAAGDTYAAGSTGGNVEHTHKYGFQFGAYYGAISMERDAQSGALQGGTGNPVGSASISSSMSDVNDNVAQAAKTLQMSHYKSTADTSSASNMPPYLAVYAWKRTA